MVQGPMSGPNSDRSGRAARRSMSREVEKATQRLEQASRARHDVSESIRVTVDKGETVRVAAEMGISPYKLLGFAASTGITPGQVGAEWRKRQAAAQAAQERGLDAVSKEAGETLIDEALEAAEAIAEILGPEKAAEVLGVQPETHGDGPAEQPDVEVISAAEIEIIDPTRP